MPAPIDLSTITFSPQATNFSKTLSSLKKSTLSIPNRLKSITSDAEFVKSVAAAYGFPLVANERCGSWYIRPADKVGSAYFKSTDGHTGEWSFSLRRLNVQVFDVLREHGGCVVVDSTRRGKSMPDALMKTVPVWCAVFNRLLFPGEGEAGRLRTPPNCVSASEHAQIEARIAGFVSALGELKLDLVSLRANVKKPLRPIWVTREAELPVTPPRFENFHPLVLCTASRRVVGTEISEGGYIQGAGDDAEGWSLGLTPPVFWRHHEELMDADEDGIADLIAALVSQEATAKGGQKATMVKNATWLSVGSLAALTAGAAYNYDAIITVGLHSALPTVPLPSRKHLHLECRKGKLGSRDLRTQFPLLRPFIDSISSRRRILVCDDEGKDLAPGVALALLCLYAHDSGEFESGGTGTSIDKSFIKRRLSWIMTSLPSASPSRATLQSVNDYLLTEHTKTVQPPTLGTLSIAEKASTTSLAEKIFTSLEGTWTMDRTIENRLPTGLAGTVKGTAVFTSRSPTSEDAHAECLYHEEGTFNAGPGINMTVNRRWIWRLSTEEETPSISIHFVKADGETEDYLYNKLPLPHPEGEKEKQMLAVEVEHPCGKDFYVSKYSFFLGLDGRLQHWIVRHEVKGPAKDYISTTAHARA